MRREFKAYFTSPIGYIVVAAIFFISGVFFTQMVAYGIADMRSVFSTMYTFIMFLMPMLTMRLMSEDKKIKTDQILLTSPVTITGCCSRFHRGFQLHIGRVPGARHPRHT